VANISGARLRETERQLTLLRGEEAVAAFLDAHPNETKVLQQLVDWRRAGRSVPALPRVQRAMLWSDGTIELRTEAGAEAGRGPTVSPPTRGVPPSAPHRAGRPSGPSRAAPYGARPGRPAPGGRGAPGQRPSGERVLGSFVADSSGQPIGRRPSARGAPGHPGRDGESSSLHGLPREGEGWSLVRPGEAPPDAEPQAEPHPAPTESHAAARAAGPHTSSGDGEGSPEATSLPQTDSPSPPRGEGVGE
jgi:hypothetical protein